MSEVELIKRQAMRLARLAALSAPTVILAEYADRLDQLVTAHCTAAGFDRAAHRAEREAEWLVARAAAEPLTAAEEADLSAEEAAYEAAEAKAQKASGYSEEVWLRLDTGYRFDLVMAHYEEPAR